jgi:bile acid:Na+ symporter, BASS family
MDLATLVSAAVQTSVCLIVFSLGLGSTQEDALYLLRRPRQLVRSLLSMNVVMPLVAAGLAAVFDFTRALNIALVALAVSPVPLFFRRGSGGPVGAHPMRSDCWWSRPCWSSCSSRSP